MMWTTFLQFLSIGSILLKPSYAAREGRLDQNLPPLVTLPAPTIEVNHSNNHWKGLTYHYRIPHPDTGVIIEDFSIYLIDGGFHEHEGNESHDDSRVTTNSAAPALFQIQPRTNWICAWIYGCIDTTVESVSISSAQIAAAAAALGNDLRDDSYAKSKVLIRGFIYEFTMGIVTNVVASYFVTNKVQAQDPTATDTCGSAQINNLENMILQLQANIQDLGARIQEGDSRPRGYDRYAETTDTQQEGAHLKHTVKPTSDPEDYKTIAGCDLGDQ